MTAPSVLVVEDDTDLREIWTEALTREGFRCTAAGDGDEAIALLGEASPQLVITDFSLPMADGLDVCRAIRTHDGLSQVPILLLTGNLPTHPRIAEALQLPHVTLQEKPVSLRRLGDLARALIAASAAQDGGHREG